MIDLDKMLYDRSEAAESRKAKKRDLENMRKELGPGYEGLSEEAVKSELEKKQSKARYEAIKALGNSK
jgi:hypothetical protein